MNARARPSTRAAVRLAVVLVGGPLCAALASPALAADETSEPPARLPSVRRPWSMSVFATAFVGDGLRFNNPFRLATQLGSDARSVSRTASYADVGAALALGDPASASHGLALRASVAVEGVPQAVLTPSYVLFRRWNAWAAYGRAGLPVVVTPDPTWGVEGAAGGVWFVRAGIGLAAELVGDLFYGAGTREVATPAYPVLSGQAGVWLSWEAWP